MPAQSSGPSRNQSPPRTGGVADGAADRSWDARASTRGPAGASLTRKPDVCLLDRTYRGSLGPTDRLNWGCLKAFAEVTNRAVNHEVNNTILQKAYLIFQTQPARRFVYALGFYGPSHSFEWTLTLVDRTGIVRTARHDAFKHNGITLLRVLFGLAFGSDELIGLDPTIKLDAMSGIPVAIDVTTDSGPTRTFSVVRLIHNADSLMSRGTRVWIVSERNRFYALKDAWASEGTVSEALHLKHLQKVYENHLDAATKAKVEHTFPRLVLHQEWPEDDTGKRRFLLNGNFTIREHRRIVTGPVGDPITSFCSKVEFLSCIKNIVERESSSCLLIIDVPYAPSELQFNSKFANLIHCDLSLGNILISRVHKGGFSLNNDHNPTHAHEFLEDFDGDSDSFDLASNSEGVEGRDESMEKSDEGAVSDDNDDEGMLEDSQSSTTMQRFTAADNDSKIEVYGLLIDYDYAKQNNVGGKMSATTS
ncbi:hypothetical protein H0H92_010853, partial [Tricholoma furcatifolium]